MTLCVESFEILLELKFKINYKYNKILNYNFNLFNFIIKKRNIISAI